MSSTQISDFLKNLHLLTLPTPLWAVHVDPKQEFIAILHVSLSAGKVSIDKGALVSFENGALKATGLFNGDVVNIPDLTLQISTVSELGALIYRLHSMKLCPNNATDSCFKYVFKDNSNLCDLCAAQETSDEFCGFEEAPRDDKPFKCNACGRGFAKKYNLNVHSRVHSGEKPYVCTKCGKMYSTRSNLVTHMNSTHLENKKHECELCKMCFVHPRVLKIHMRKHTGEKPYMCQVCGKVFAKNIHLTVHMRTHTGERPHVCGVCGKGFTTSGNLNSHKKINHNRL